ncbi:MAG: type II secretion system protein [Neptuniibacter sp.]
MPKQVKQQKGFTLIELMIVMVIIGGLIWITVPAYTEYQKRTEQHRKLQTQVSGICQMNKKSFTDFVGGLSVGTAITAGAAKSSFILIVTETGVLIGTAAAVAPVVTFTAGSAAAGYVALKGYCTAKEPPVLYHFAVDQVSETMEIVHDKAGRIISLFK